MPSVVFQHLQYSLALSFLSNGYSHSSSKYSFFLLKHYLESILINWIYDAFACFQNSSFIYLSKWLF